MLSSVEILILSAIQGISEFLPVSSAAHLVLVSSIYEFKNQSLLIDVSLHLGSLIAILYYFKNDIFEGVVPLHPSFSTKNHPRSVVDDSRQCLSIFMTLQN